MACKRLIFLKWVSPMDLPFRSAFQTEETWQPQNWQRHIPWNIHINITSLMNIILFCIWLSCLNFHVCANNFWFICIRNFILYILYVNVHLCSICIYIYFKTLHLVALFVLTFQCFSLYDIKYWNVYVKNFKFMHIHICVLWLCTWGIWQFLFLIYHPYLFSFCHMYVKNSWNICVRNLKNCIHLHPCALHMYTNNLNNTPCILCVNFSFCCIIK